ncbi:MAG: sulfatase-like hydrolase/transferase [Phycisphaerae bacterium]|nr:sulfatase-like hydrolase/transferase [Phycisphaerae bacterium]NUQ44417.1 sulfatase-like hydrolase/transferase [Phycisphaerae bacterium]
MRWGNACRPIENLRIPSATLASRRLRRLRAAATLVFLFAATFNGGCRERGEAATGDDVEVTATIQQPRGDAQPAPASKPIPSIQRPRPSRPTRRPLSAPDIVLVTLDTTRADYADDETMPFLCQFARSGIRYTRALAMSSETGPSHASILTGLQPHQHGVLRNCEPFDYPARLPLGLFKSGYETAAFVSAVPLRKGYGFAIGFSHFDDAGDPQYRNVNLQRGGRKTIDAALDWLGKRQWEVPMFLWVHLFDPHAPYDPEDLPREQHVRRRELGEILSSARPVDEETKARIRGVYRRELRQTDGHLQRLFEAVLNRSTRGVLSCIVADHGEELFDRGNFCEHDRSLYQGVLHVPLVLRWDAHLLPSVIERPVSIGSVGATLLELAGHDPFPNTLPPLPLDPTPPEQPPVIVARRTASGIATRWPVCAVVRGEHKALFYKPGRGPELYDLQEDPGEKRNLANDRPNLLNELRTALLAIAPMEITRPEITLDAKTRNALKSLGYLGDDDGDDAPEEEEESDEGI